ncbi:Protein of unknown function [Cognatiyoonia sediminum]|uniref:DUF1150 family protein n=1 Tax=Cognatiyoonia sediminum TaxID=1508389 RepID=A0A1M5NR64_9RHOB|nr:DUF1150 family protein [Cognatiyoonia sediminum]SHG91967.1 Protein of unknown function [Cognatiyoonia sediminum]
MQRKHELKALAGNMIYLKPVATSDLPDEVREDAGSLGTVFAVHNTEGEQVALVANEAIAADLAAQNDMQVVSVH